MNRPNFLDMAVYRLFAWWWNPIFIAKPDMAQFLIAWLDKYKCGWNVDGEPCDMVITFEKRNKNEVKVREIEN